MAPPIRDWKDLLPDDVRRVCTDAIFRKVEQAYASSGRRYHSFQHIRACLELARQIPFDRPERALLALLLHDAIYVPGRKDNEELSARFAGDVLGSESRLEAGDIAAVQRMIRLTADHASDGSGMSADEKRVVDIDMSVLGGSWQGYLAYCGGVFGEFCPAVVDETQFRAGRRAFLERQLARPGIFLLPEFRSTFEVSARANIRRELDELLPAPGPLGAVIAMALGGLLGLTR
ncbi:MAG: HD domain-containing protein [Burkholderiales bacterium]